MSTVAEQIMSEIFEQLEDERDEEELEEEGALPLQPPIERDAVLTLDVEDLDFRALNWGPDTSLVREPGRPPVRRDDPIDRRTLSALLAIRCRARYSVPDPDADPPEEPTLEKTASQVADECVAFAVSKLCGLVQRGSPFAGLADRIYLADRMPRLGPGNPALFMVVLDFRIDYWNVVGDAERVT